MNEKQSLDETHIEELLWKMLQRQAHELHLEVGREPCVRRDGEQASHELDEYEKCKPQHIQAMVYDIISDEQIQRFENDLRLVFMHWMMEPVGTRFIVVVERLRRNVAVSFCSVPAGERLTST